MAWTLLIIPQGCIPYHDIPSMPTPFAVSMTALSRDLSRCNLGHKTELFSQCHAKVQNLLQFANNFTTFNDKINDEINKPDGYNYIYNVTTQVVCPSANLKKG